MGVWGFMSCVWGCAVCVSDDEVRRVVEYPVSPRRRGRDPSPGLDLMEIPCP